MSSTLATSKAQFAPVWISSLSHLAAVKDILQKAPFWRRRVGTFVIPAGFPYVSMNRIQGYSARLPTFMFSQGQFDLASGILYYKAFDFSFPLDPQFSYMKWHDLWTDWTFTLTHSEILSVEPFTPGYPVPRAHGAIMTRILTRRNDVLEDFLIWVGGVTQVGRKTHSEELFYALRAFSSPVPQLREEPSLAPYVLSG